MKLDTIQKTVFGALTAIRVICAIVLLCNAARLLTGGVRLTRCAKNLIRMG